MRDANEPRAEVIATLLKALMLRPLAPDPTELQRLIDSRDEWATMTERRLAYGILRAWHEAERASKIAASDQLGALIDDLTARQNPDVGDVG
jgi:hypothetical protein